MSTLVFLLEEPSAQDALEGILPKVLPDYIAVTYIVFEGKQDLEKRMMRKMRGWLTPDSRFVVLRDQDSGDCSIIKQNLMAKCHKSGQPDFLVRIACRELESWFVGDWEAVGEAFEVSKLKNLVNKANYRNPDNIGSPVEELRKYLPDYQKRDGARRIAPLLEFDRNSSRSFQVFVDGVKRLTG